MIHSVLANIMDAFIQTLHNINLQNTNIQVSFEDFPLLINVELKDLCNYGVNILKPGLKDVPVSFHIDLVPLQQTIL
jgi:hypothetical protein